MNWLKDKSHFILISFLLGFCMILFLVVPLIGSLTGSASDIPTTLTDGRTINAILLSFYCALLSTVVIFLFGVPLAFLFTRFEFPGKKVVDSLIDLPILIPHNAAGIALLTVLGPYSFPGKILGDLGVNVVDTAIGIVAAMIFVSAPFMVRSAQEAFASVSPEMEQIAKSLGASDFKVFRHVTFPLALRGILTGCLLSWTRAISEFGAVVILSYYPKTVPVLLYDVFVSEGLKAALPINGILIILAIVILITFKLVTSQSRKAYLKQ